MSSDSDEIDMPRNGQKDEESIQMLLLSRLISSIPVDHIKNIYTNFIQKEVKANITLEQCEEMYMRCLYEPNFAKNVIQSPNFLRRTFKSVAPTKEEEFYVYLVKRYYGTLALRELSTNLRSHLLFQHSDQQIKKIYESISNMDQTKLSQLVAQYAFQLATEELPVVNETFTEEELANAGVSKELYEWWKQSLNMPEEPAQQSEINSALLCDAKIETIERSLEFLMQSPLPNFGWINTTERDYMVKSKHFLLYDEKIEDTDILLTDFPGFAKPESGNFGALIMFKKDTEFYLENVGTETIVVDAIPIYANEVIYLKDNSVIEFGDAACVFKINWVFINNIRQVMVVQ